MESNTELSIVIPVYNEEANLAELLARTRNACNSLNTVYELILIDDGSSDLSAAMIEHAAAEHPDEIKGVFLSANFGQHAAVTAGLQTASGRYVITMDADLQNPPEELHKLLAKLREGYDVVGTIRAIGMMWSFGNSPPVLSITWCGNFATGVPCVITAVCSEDTAVRWLMRF